MKSMNVGRTIFGLCATIVCAGHAQQLTTASAMPNTTSTVTTTGGTAGIVPVFNGASSIINSKLYYMSGQLGVGKVPATALDVAGDTHFGGAGLYLPTATATASKAYSSNSLRLQASAYNSSTKAAVGPYLQFTAEPVGSNTASPGASLHLLYNGGSGGSIESGLYFNANGTIHFAPAQTFPIAAGPQGPVGPAGPTGATGATGATGPQGPAGGLTLPYAGGGATPDVGDGAPLFSISNDAVHGTGISGTGGNAPYSGDDPNPQVTNGGIGVLGNGGGGEGGGGAGLAGYGGSAQSGDAGAGVIAYGGESSYANGGAGIMAVGGLPDNDDGGTRTPVAGIFIGDVNVQGNLSKSGGSFKIDDPIDPSNKYLYHSFVESPDMKNIYDGSITTDGRGEAIVAMPDYFEALNRDFRYQLTVIGQFAQAIVATKISGGVFIIKTDKPNVEVSWQVTGVRQDAWANAHRIPIEVDKLGKEKGRYLHPELFGQPRSRQILPAGVVLREPKTKQQ